MKSHFILGSPSRRSYIEHFILFIYAIVMAGLIMHKMVTFGTDRELYMCEDPELKHFPNGTVDFRGFNNYTGYKSGCYVVPDIVHLIKFNQNEFTFIEMICIASILANHKPRILMIHTNDLEFFGRYWNVIQRLSDFHRIRVVYLAQPTSIFGVSLISGYSNWHASDVARLELIQKYGGIYLDADVYVTQSLNQFRRFEFVVEWNNHMNLGNQVLIGHKDARIIPHWLDTYKEYNGSLWYYNGRVLPTKAVLSKMSELFHRVRNQFGTSTAMLNILYSSEFTELWNWREYPAIHLFIRHQDYQFDENSTLKYKESPIQQMILDVMPNSMIYETM